jgi:hypothetical protein
LFTIRVCPSTKVSELLMLTLKWSSFSQSRSKYKLKMPPKPDLLAECWRECAFECQQGNCIVKIINLK